MGVGGAESALEWDEQDWAELPAVIRGSHVTEMEAGRWEEKLWSLNWKDLSAGKSPIYLNSNM